MDVADPTQDDDNLIMVGGIAGEEVRKFGRNLKSFSEWKREVNRVLKSKKSLRLFYQIPDTSLRNLFFCGIFCLSLV